MGVICVYSYIVRRTMSASIHNRKNIMGDDMQAGAIWFPVIIIIMTMIMIITIMQNNNRDGMQEWKNENRMWKKKKSAS